MNLFSTTIVLAYRNLFRNRARTISTLLAIAVGLLGLTVLDGFITYSMDRYRDAIIRSGTGHLQIFRSRQALDEGDDNPIPFLLDKPRRMAEELRALPEVDDVMPALDFSALLSDGNENLSVQVSAYPLDQAARDLSKSTLTAGRDLAPGETGRVLLGTCLARRLKLRPGATIQLFAQSRGGGVNTESLTVEGITSSGIKYVDDISVHMSLSDAQSLLEVGSVAKLVVFLKHSGDTGRVMRLLAAAPPSSALSGMMVESWDKLSLGFQYANSMYQLILAVARFVVLIVALFSISGSLTLSVIERYREMGTLRALGTPRRRLTLLLAFEAPFLGAAGAALGSFLAMALTASINVLGGITFPAEPGMSVSAVNILFTPRVGVLAQNGAALVLASIAASLAPGALGTRRSVAELLRSV